VRLYVADYNNNRVLVWNTIPTISFAAANFALGQSSLTTNSSGTSASTLSRPWAIHSDGTRLFVSDYNNNRVLVWNSLPSASGTSADFALGQPNLVSNTSNNGGVSGSSLSFPDGVYSSGGRLFVSDYDNSRVLVWSSMPTGNGQAANAVIGQPDLTSRSANNGGLTSQSLQYPIGIYVDGTRVFIADESNFRILIAPIPGI
jgi:hypothetical protein